MANPERLSPLPPSSILLQGTSKATQLLGWLGQPEVHTRQISSPAPDISVYCHVCATNPDAISAKGAGGKQKWKLPKMGTAGPARAC